MDPLRHRLTFLAASAVLSLLAALIPIPAAAQIAFSHDLHQYTAPGLQDLALTLKTGQYNKQAGRKISKEFGLLYRISGNGTFHYRAPDQIRLDGRLDGAHGVLLMEGFTQRIRVGPFHHNQRQLQAPGKIATLLDVGLINSFYLSYTLAQYQGMATVEGVTCAVFRLTYMPLMQDTSFRLIWIDPRTRVIRKREEHGQDGALRAVYTYRQPQEATPGLWLPTEVDATNALGEFVGQTFVQDVRVNQGLTEKLFQ